MITTLILNIRPDDLNYILVNYSSEKNDHKCIDQSDNNDSIRNEMAVKHKPINDQ